MIIYLGSHVCLHAHVCIFLCQCVLCCAVCHCVLSVCGMWCVVCVCPQAPCYYHTTESTGEQSSSSATKVGKMAWHKPPSNSSTMDLSVTYSREQHHSSKTLLTFHLTLSHAHRHIIHYSICIRPYTTPSIPYTGP